MSDQSQSDMITLRYAGSPLFADYLRGGGGVLLSGAPLLLVDVHWVPAVIFASVLAVFGAFLIRTALRHVTTITVDDSGLHQSGPIGKSLRWADLNGMTLKYFSARRDRTDGWMSLKVTGPKTTLRLESTLDGFDRVVERAAQSIRTNNVAIDTVTRANLSALGLETPPSDLDPSNPDGDGEPRLRTDGWDWSTLRKGEKNPG